MDEDCDDVRTVAMMDLVHAVGSARLETKCYICRNGRMSDFLAFTRSDEEE